MRSDLNRSLAGYPQGCPLKDTLKDIQCLQDSSFENFPATRASSPSRLKDSRIWRTPNHPPAHAADFTANSSRRAVVQLQFPKPRGSTEDFFSPRQPLPATLEPPISPGRFFHF